MYNTNRCRTNAKSLDKYTSNKSNKRMKLSAEKPALLVNQNNEDNDAYKSK